MLCCAVQWRILRIMHSVSEVLEMDHEEREEAHHKLLAQARQVWCMMGGR